MAKKNAKQQMSAALAAHRKANDALARAEAGVILAARAAVREAQEALAAAQRVLDAAQQAEREVCAAHPRGADLLAERDAERAARIERVRAASRRAARNAARKAAPSPSAKLHRDFVSLFDIRRGNGPACAICGGRAHDTAQGCADCGAA